MDDSTRLAKKLKKADCAVELEIWDKMFHVWHYLGAVVPEAKDAINAIGNFIQQLQEDALDANSSKVDVPYKLEIV